MIFIVLLEFRLLGKFLVPNLLPRRQVPDPWDLLLDCLILRFWNRPSSCLTGSLIARNDHLHVDFLSQLLFRPSISFSFAVSLLFVPHSFNMSISPSSILRSSSSSSLTLFLVFLLVIFDPVLFRLLFFQRPFSQSLFSKLPSISSTISTLSFQELWYPCSTQLSHELSFCRFLILASSRTIS